ncbi:MAG: metallophosphoesterase, partial [Clostridia bacterium]|nr:metallophosphoesterase [Clostridia bacterium]
MKGIKVLAMMLALTLGLAACGGTSDTSSATSTENSTELSQTESTVSEETAEKGELKTAFRFLVTSDNHISTVNDMSAKRLAQLFKSSYAYAETQEYNKIDAFVAVGDITNYGQAYEYQAWKSIVNENIKDETQVVTVMGNHEFYGNLNDLEWGVKGYTENIDTELNKHVVIGGYHFIGVSTYGEGDYSE